MLKPYTRNPKSLLSLKPLNLKPLNLKTLNPRPLKRLNLKTLRLEDELWQRGKASCSSINPKGPKDPIIRYSG